MSGATKMLKKLKEGELVKVLWTATRATDASNWVNRHDAELRLLRAHTIGWVVSVEREGLIISASKCFDTDEVADIMSIPVNSIRSIDRAVQVSWEPV